VFETRVPAFRAWEAWTRSATYRAVDVAGGVETWTDLLAVAPPLVTVRTTRVFVARVAPPRHRRDEHGTVVDPTSPPLRRG